MKSIHLPKDVPTQTPQRVFERKLGRTAQDVYGFKLCLCSPPKNFTEAVADFSWDSESPWTHLLNAADNQGYVLTSNEAGNLYLTKGGRNAGYWHFIIAEGMNVKSVETTESGAEQYCGRQRMQLKR